MRRYFLLLLASFLCAGACSGSEGQPEHNPALSLSLSGVESDAVRLDLKLIHAEGAWLLVRPAAAGEALPQAEEVKSAGRYVSAGEQRVEGLTPETAYGAYACAAAADGRLGKVESLFFTSGLGQEHLYRWEQQRSELPFFADLVLLYGSSSARQPYQWTRERLAPYVSYTDPAGQESWLFDAFLLLEGLNTSSWHTYMVGNREWDDGSGAPRQARQSADKADAQAFLDYWFTGLQALDAAIADAATRLGPPPLPRRVVFMMPDLPIHQRYDDPTSSTRYWGFIDGRQLDFAQPQDRIAAYCWYVDEVRERFARCQERGELSYLELGAFYIMSEELPSVRAGLPGQGENGLDGWEVEAKAWDAVFPAVSDYIHRCREALCWIPYRDAAGYRYWSEFGIDYAYMQPNRYWDLSGAHPMDDFFSKISRYRLAMELEMDDKMISGYDPEGPEGYRSRWIEYLDGLRSERVYGQKPLALYQDYDAFLKLQASSDPLDQELYHELAALIAQDPLKSQNR